MNCLQTDMPHSDGVTRRSCRLCKKHYGREWRINNKEKYLSKQREDYNKNKSSIKNKAKKIVAVAVRTGKLDRAQNLDCVDCGAKAEVWEHRDYSKPLDVEPVCRVCNVKRGPAWN